MHKLLLYFYFTEACVYTTCYVYFKCASVCVETFAHDLCTYVTTWEGINEVF